MIEPTLSPFIITSADPLCFNKTLIWLSSKMGRQLLRVDSDQWLQFCQGLKSEPELIRRFGTSSKDLPSKETRERLQKDETRSYTKIIMPSAACPHGCCLPSYGDYCGQKHDNRSLASDQKSELTRELDEAFRQDFESYNIGFFGAEPLTRWRFIVELMTNISELATQYNKRSLLVTKIVTSGFLLRPEVHQGLRASGVDTFEVTLDGPDYIHDARRPLKSGEGTFSKIVENLEFAKDTHSPGNFLIRINVDGRNRHTVFELLEELLRRNILPWAGVYVAPIRNWGSAKGGTQYTEMKSFATLERNVFSWLFRNGLRPELLPTPCKRTCVALSSSPSVLAPNGELYFCTETPLSEVPMQGSDKEWGDVDVSVWREGLTRGDYPCAKCELLSVCGGSCPKDWLKGNIPCPPMKFNIASRLQLLSVYEPSLVEDYFNS